MTTITIDDKKVRKKILSMTLPITAENILQMTAGVVSMAMVGRIDSVAVGAIGMSNILFRIIWAVLKGIGTGNSVFVAQSFGAGNHGKLKDTTEQAFILALGISMIFQQLIYWNTESLIGIFNPTPALLAGGTMYLRILSWSLPFTAIILLTAGILQGMGNAKTPMIIVGILNGVNIVFSYVLIFGKFGLPELGLRGAAIAYNISYGIAALMGLIVLFGKNGTFAKLGGGFKLRFNRTQSIRLIRFAIPTSFEMSFWQFASIIITRAVLTYGEVAYAAYQLGLQAESISYMPAAGFGIAASTFVGQSVGSRDSEMGKTYMKHLIRLSLVVTSVAGGLMIVLPSQIMRAFSNDPEIIAVGAVYLFIMGLLQIPQNLAGLLNGALRGAGYPKASMINVGVGLWLVRVPLVLFMTYVMDAGIEWIWIMMGVDLLVRFILAVFTYRRKNIFNSEKEAVGSIFL